MVNFNSVDLADNGVPLGIRAWRYFLVEQLHNIISIIHPLLVPVGIIVRTSFQPKLCTIEHATWTLSLDFVPVLVEPDPVGHHVADDLEKYALVPVGHLSVL